MTPPPDALLAGEAATVPAGAEAMPAHVPVTAVATGQPLVKAKERYVYLDAMKGVMILWGIPVHACVVSHSKFFHLVSDISNTVRMEAFFMISGFLSYMLVKRYGAGTIMKKRTIATGIPFLTVVALLNPITNWLILQYHAHGMSGPPPTLGEFFTGHIPPEYYAKGAPTWNWHLHIWFLAVLLCLASLSAPIMKALDRAKAALKPVVSRMPDWLLLLGAAAAAVFLCGVARLGFEAVVKKNISESFHYPLRMVGYYFAFFALGMATYTSPRILKVFTRCHWFQLLLGWLGLWGGAVWLKSFPEGSHSTLKQVAEMVNLSAQVYLAVVFVPVLFAFFKRFCSGTQGTMRLSAMHWVNLVSSAVLLVAAKGLEHLLPQSGTWGVSAATASPTMVKLAAFAERMWVTPDQFSTVVMLAVEGYFFVMACLVIFGLFERFIKKPGAPMHFVAESAFCVYLFHYLVIYLNAFWLRDLVGIKDDYTLSFLVTFFTAGVTMLIYEFAVNRNAVLKCLFLGKLPKREKATEWVRFAPK